MAVFVPGYSGGTATDSNRLPYSPVSNTLAGTRVGAGWYLSAVGLQPSENHAANAETFWRAGRRQPPGTDSTRKVAGTFHVPSAFPRLTAHGMCPLLFKVSSLGLIRRGGPRSPVLFVTARGYVAWFV